MSAIVRQKEACTVTFDSDYKNINMLKIEVGRFLGSLPPVYIYP